MIAAGHIRVPFLLSGMAALLTLGVAGYSALVPSVYLPTTPARLLPGAVSQDIISVIAALGVLACLAIARRRPGAWLIWTGLVGYLFYAYALYAFERVYNPFFLVYVAVVGLVVYALVTFFRRADLDLVRPVGERPPPRRTVAVLFLLLVVLFLNLWLSILLPAMVSRVPPDGSAIFVLDLAFFLPLLATEAVLLLRRRPLGDALAVPILVKVATLGCSVLVGTLIAPRFGQPLDMPSVAIYGLLGLGPLALAGPFLARLRIDSR